MSHFVSQEWRVKFPPSREERRQKGEKDVDSIDCLPIKPGNW